MKKQEVKIVKAAVQRSAKLDQGMKVELGLTDKKEQQRLNKTFKPFAADPIVKKAVKGKSFAQWVGRIELLDGEQLSVLQADRFGKRMVYLLPSDETGELTTLPESTFTPEQVKELLHMANVCSADERDKLLFKAETVAAPAENWEELLATCGEADRRFLDKVRDMLAKEIAHKLPKILRKSLDTAAVMMAAIDEQLHTMGGSVAPMTRYRFETQNEQTAAWLAGSQADDAEGLASLDEGVGDCIYTRPCRGCRGCDYAAVEWRAGSACGARVGDGGPDGAHLLNTAGEDSIFP